MSENVQTTAESTTPETGSGDGEVSGVEIQLENVTKRYPGTREAAVDNFSMTVPAGKIVVFVGPSGCGKTTTMRMINRLVEPSSGHIYLDGEDIGAADPVALRRRMGYDR